MLFAYSEIAAAFPWFFPAVAFMIGACVGSFLNVVIYRVPKNESVVTPGSHCACGQPIKFYDNIPILSWLLLRGRARCCGRKFSFRYPAIELLTGVLFVACWLRFSPHGHFSPAVVACACVFISCLIAATFIDLDHFIIPDRFTIGLGIVGVALSFAVPQLHGFHTGHFSADSLHSGLHSLEGLLVGSGLVLWTLLLSEALLQKEAMGFGDVKFVGAIGAFCGWQGAVFAMFGGAVVGVAWIGLAWVGQKIFGASTRLTPPTELPTEEEAVVEHNHWDVLTLGAGVAGVIASILVPALHGQNSGMFMLDGLRSGTAALYGLLVGSALVLWVWLCVPILFKNDAVMSHLVKGAGALGAFSNWQLGVRGFLFGLLWTAVGGVVIWVLWLGTTRLRLRFARSLTSPEPAEDAVEGEPPALGLGVHVPFGPMLAIAAALYFLGLRDFIGAWFAEVSALF
jgi:leader peptidase (prepilin peptidase)/N-methyltransferase